MRPKLRNRRIIIPFFALALALAMCSLMAVDALTLGTTYVFTPSVNVNDYIRGAIYTVTQGGGEVTALHSYLRCSGTTGVYTGNATAAIYNGTDLSLLAVSNVLQLENIPVTWAWYNFTFASPPTIVNGSSYLLCLWAFNDTVNNRLLYASRNASAEAVANQYVSKGTTYLAQNFPATIATPTLSQYVSTIYVDYSLVGPSYGAITANTTTTGASVNLQCTVQDEDSVASYIWSSNNTGVWVNGTETAFSGTSATASHSFIWNSTGGTIVSVKLYANDTSNVWTSADMQHFTLATPTYSLSLRTTDASSTVLTNTTVFMSNGTQYSQATSAGWANWTGISSGTVCSVNASWNGVYVNNTFTANVAADTVLDVSCRAYNFTWGGVTHYVAVDRDVASASWSYPDFTVNMGASTTSNNMVFDMVQRPTYLLGLNYTSTAWNASTGLFNSAVANTTSSVTISFANWGSTYLQDTQVPLNTLGWNVKKLSGTATAATAGALTLYCGSSRADPEKTTGISGVYSTSTTVLACSYSAGSLSFSFDWTVDYQGGTDTPVTVTLNIPSVVIEPVAANQTSQGEVDFTFSTSSFTVLSLTFQGEGAGYLQATTTFPAALAGGSGTIQLQVTAPADAVPGNYTAQITLAGLDPYGSHQSVTAPLSFVITPLVARGAIGANLFAGSNMIWLLLGLVAVAVVVVVALVKKR